MSDITTTSSGQCWIKPETKISKDEPTLKLYNTLTHTKVEFIPRSKEEVTWYSCGPTVYNVSHMGHARNYVTIDINRRILQDYFNYNVKFVQNVTDIDDKIILKARQEYLFKQYTDPLDGKVTDGLVSKAREGLSEYVRKNLPEFKEEDTFNGPQFRTWASALDLKQIGLTKPKVPMHVKACLAALDAIENASTISFESFLSSTKDVIVPLLDLELGSTVTDPAIFRNCSAFWEKMYDSDMRRLNVLPPTVTTRVSEYIPEIVDFVAGIVEQGFGYVTKDGSVYFNTAKFDQDPNHTYAKNQPWSKHDMELIEDAEGSLSLDHPESKLNPSDFALWKASKSGEPAWPSPWGKGRPGWHIECSVMASDFFGDGMDIHSGGIDLAFPHHDNESAQSEARFGCKQWVNYFLHTGHLHIQGQKMSKSLKNFITIDEALNTYSARELRLCFALVQWNSPLDFKDSLLSEARGLESAFSKFFQRIRALKLDNESRLEAGELISKKFGPLEKKLLQDLDTSKTKVHAALCDNLATPLALRALSDLVTQSNTYISEVGADVKVDLLIQVVEYITKIVGIFGFTIRPDQLGWEEGKESKSGSTSDIAMPYVRVLAQFRDLVRQTAIDKGDYKILLEASDRVRDKDLLALNVALDDRSQGQSSLIKFVSEKEKQELIQQQEEKEKQQEEKRQKKLLQKKQNEEKEKARLEIAKIDPKEMFRTAEYSEWDEDGIPTKDKEGEELSKSARKKLTKQWKQQEKLHEKFASGSK
ncbi:DEKNAAC103730 [Brettanomyces naardenensis]|uniref:cysteine--tRNA ligase n=1 Tax=Brettanomyces naardenensis TaxID=13370 RepID=A0A448YP37_BRENA|nr:DEKNAAC103730 [Brettanomyces naardenensis]